MRIKPHILTVASTATLRQIVDDYELEVADKRKREMLESTISGARRCKPEELLAYLNEQEIKQVCDAAGVDQRGRKNALIERLLGVDPPAPTQKKALEPKRLSNQETTVNYHSPKRKLMNDKKPVQGALQIDGQETGVASVEKYEFEPIKGYPMLNWRGKRPFTSTQYYPAQLKELLGEEQAGWRNKIFWGDNLQVMSHMLKSFRGKVDLIYIDPPFDSKAEYKKTIELKGAQAESDQSSFEEKQYGDIWSNDEYLQFMFERLVMMRELLKETGSIYLHCDWNKSHHLRCLLDEVFGPTNFRNELYWYYYNKMPDSRKGVFPRATDTILWYAKDKSKAVFHPLKESRDQPVKQLVRKKVDGKMINARDENGNVMYQISDSRVIDNVWRLSMLQPADRTENLFYPTQKPEHLIERILSASSNPGDLVFDCFMGSGTTQAVALKLGRRYIGADINLGAIQTTIKRLIKIDTDMRQKPLDEGITYYNGIEVFNVNHYDIFRNPVQAKELLIEALEVQVMEQSTVFDGEKDGRMVKIMPVNRIATRADLNELIAGFNYKAWERRQKENPNKAVEKITLVCMGHEPDLMAQLELAAQPFKIDVEVVDILRDKANLEFKRDSEAKILIKKGELVVDRFFPMNLLQKLSLQKAAVEDWRELVESILIDWNYDGAVLQPSVVDIPDRTDLVIGRYKVPDEAGTIRVKITDLLSESWEGSLNNG
jgi:adenine-specific DNA-methyltransferase